MLLFLLGFKANLHNAGAFFLMTTQQLLHQTRGTILATKIDINFLNNSRR